MRTRLQPILFLLAMAPIAGCATYRNIELVEPSQADGAVVHVEYIYDSRPGPKLQESMTVNVVPRINGERVFAGAQVIHVGVSFYHEHLETRDQSVPYTVSESVSVYHPCASRDRHGDCEGSYERERQSKTEYRTESRSVTVRDVDATCDEAGAYRFDRGQDYLLKLHFVGAAQCTLECSVRGTTDACAHVPPDTTPPPVLATARKASPVMNVGAIALPIGILGLVAGGVTGGLAFVQANRLHDHCDTNRVCDATGLDAASLGGTFSTLSTATAIGGAGSLLLGIIFLALPRSIVRTHVESQGGLLVVVGELP
ncbi:hypothetical protein BH09MYX1_BH09MYX1_28160 [soil metagenome]